MTPRPGPAVLVDARALHASGIGRYLREILKGLFTDPRFGRITLLGEVDALRAFASEHGGEDERVVARSWAGGFYSPRAQLSWISLRARGRLQAAAAFFPHYDAPAVALPPRSVVTVQDLTHFQVSEAFPAWKRAAAGVLFDRVVSGAARVLVSSRSTRDDLLERTPAAAMKVEVIPLGVGADFRPPPEGAAAGRRAAALRPYLLCVGNRKPHKNLGAAVEALALLRRERPDLRLVVAGRKYAGDAVGERATALGVRDAVVEFDGLDDLQLRALYAHAETLLFPSLYEGFGLPVLEAMACGTPVVASDRASLPEVVGEAGLLASPREPEAIASAVRRLWDEPALKERLVRLGRERAERFTWERCAARTADVLYHTATGEALAQESVRATPAGVSR